MQSAIVNVTERTTDWRSVNWKNANRVVRRLRQRIFKATKDGDLKRVRNLQKLLMRSYSNIVLSVRRVTQLNSGKKTAGVDKLLVLTPEARGTLVDILTKLTPWKPLQNLEYLKGESSPPYLQTLLYMVWNRRSAYATTDLVRQSETEVWYAMPMTW